jgi:CheY-like chemotaxis protein
VQILIVDDRADNRLALRAILSRPDYEFQEAASGAEALRILLDREFAVLLLDVMMPGMNGFELATAIRQRARAAATPIIFKSAEAGDLEQIYRGYREGAVDYLTKPLIAEMVRAKVEVFAQLDRQRRRIERQAQALLEAQKREAAAAILELRLAAERRYRHLAYSIPEILFTADATGAIVSMRGGAPGSQSAAWEAEHAG